MNELIDYIKKKNINQIFNYLNSNKNINLLNEKNENAFNLCIQNKIPNVCYFLLQNDRLNLEVIDSDKNSYLLLALLNDYPDLALEILNKKFKNINQINIFNENAFSIALQKNYKSIIQKLFTYEYLDLSFIDVNQNTILMNLIKIQNNEGIQQILEKKEININYINNETQENALLLCVKNRNENLAIQLIENGASFDYINNNCENVYLLAIQYSLKKLIHKILNLKNNLDYKFEDLIYNTENIYFYALKAGHENLCKNIILKKKINFEIIFQDNTLLIETIQQNMFSLAYIFIKYANKQYIEYNNQENKNALTYIFEKKEYYLALEIFEKKCYHINKKLNNKHLLFWTIDTQIEKLALKILNDNLDIIDLNIYHENDSILHYALIQNMKQLSLKLIQNLDTEIINYKNNKSDNALFICIHLEYYDLIDKLLEFEDLDINAINQYGDSALILLIHKKQYKLSERLLQNKEIDKYHNTSNGSQAIDIINENNVDSLKKYF